MRGHSRSVIQDCGCDQEGRKLSWETRAEEVGIEALPKRCIVTEGIRKMFH